MGRVALGLARRRGAVEDGVKVVEARARDIGEVVVGRAFLGVLQAFEVVVKVVKSVLGGCGGAGSGGRAEDVVKVRAAEIAQVGGRGGCGGSGFVAGTVLALQRERTSSGWTWQPKGHVLPHGGLRRRSSDSDASIRQRSRHRGRRRP